LSVFGEKKRRKNEKTKRPAKKRNAQSKYNDTDIARAEKQIGERGRTSRTVCLRIVKKGNRNRAYGNRGGEMKNTEIMEIRSKLETEICYTFNLGCCLFQESDDFLKALSAFLDKCEKGRTTS
jgi:hypothetical protein